jgi:hypothetical protein
VRCRPRALTPFFWLVTNHMAMNQVLSGLRVPSKMVPAVSEVRRRQLRQRIRSSDMIQATSAAPQCGQTKPAGQRRRRT